jgi:chemotaxis protein MotB
MKHKFNSAFVVLFTIMVASACGPSKRLREATETTQVLQSQVNTLSKIAITLKHQLNALTEQNERIESAFTRYKAECTETQNKLNNTKAALQEEYDKLQLLENKIEKALADFSSKGIEVYYKNGNVYVSMEDKLLYKTGSARLGEEGKMALGNLVAAIEGYPNLKIVVLGNTDDVKFKKGSDNWSLSTERANGVVRILRDEYKLDPSRLTAAGKGMYNPVADNSTAEGRAKNRRTEIILNPDLEKFWKSIDRD